MRLIDKIPPMLGDEELIKALEKYPTYNLCKYDSKSKRLILVQDIFDVYVPNDMSIDLYHSIYFLVLYACKRKEEGLNFHSMNGDSFLLCGDSGIGKTETIARINEVMFNNKVIELDNPFCKIIPILIVQCSTVSSFKGFLISILFAIDARIGTNYGNHTSKTNVNTDELLIATTKALNLHVMVLVCEEMGFVGDSNKFMNQIVALCNVINSTVVFVCTPIGLHFFMSSDYLARRSLTKIYKNLEFEDFKVLASKLLGYNYTLTRPDVDGECIRYLYNSTGGNPALLKQVIVAAQTWAISSGYEKLSLHSLKHGVKNKLVTMEPYIKNGFEINHQKHIQETAIIKASLSAGEELVNIFSKAARIALKDQKKMINHLEQYMDVERVNL